VRLALVAGVLPVLLLLLLAVLFLPEIFPINLHKRERKRTECNAEREEEMTRSSDERALKEGGYGWKERERERERERRVGV
jgi:hypothetical protein